MKSGFFERATRARSPKCERETPPKHKSAQPEGRRSLLFISKLCGAIWRRDSEHALSAALGAVLAVGAQNLSAVSQPAPEKPALAPAASGELPPFYERLGFLCLTYSRFHPDFRDFLTRNGCPVELITDPNSGLEIGARFGSLERPALVSQDRKDRMDFYGKYVDVALKYAPQDPNFCAYLRRNEVTVNLADASADANAPKAAFSCATTPDMVDFYAKIAMLTSHYAKEPRLRSMLKEKGITVTFAGEPEHEAYFARLAASEPNDANELSR